MVISKNIGNDNGHWEAATKSETCGVRWSYARFNRIPANQIRGHCQPVPLRPVVVRNAFVFVVKAQTHSTRDEKAVELVTREATDTVETNEVLSSRSTDGEMNLS